MKRTISLLLCIFISVIVFSQNKEISISINPNKVIASYKKEMLLGTNAGVYYKESDLLDLDFRNHLQNLHSGIIRIPGGSWSNELYWNGNRVRISTESYIPKEEWENAIKNKKNPMQVAFDTTRYRDDYWQVDYKGFNPGFRVHDIKGHLSDFHGFTNVLFLHKYIREYNAQTMVTVNITSAPVKAAVEWVKWTKQRAYYANTPFNVKYWELGNELDGHWELGHFLKDGSKMTAKEYIKRYKKYAIPMKEADPTIKVGGSVASNNRLAFVEELIKDTNAPLDFVSFHTYPSKKEETDFITLSKRAEEINKATAKIKKWIAKYRPNDKDRIEIALSEWNLKVEQDLTTVDLTNTLWSAMMLGEIAKSGVNIAIQWDMFSTTDSGGHGLFNPKDLSKPRSQYWAMYLWSNFMENKLIETKFNLPEYVKVYATTNNDEIALMLINGSKTEKVNVKLNSLTKRKFKLKEISYSNDNYKLNLKTLLPKKSEKPTIKEICYKAKKGIILSPYSVKIIKFQKSLVKH